MTELSAADLAAITARFPHPDCTGYQPSSAVCVINALLGELTAARGDLVTAKGAYNTHKRMLAELRAERAELRARQVSHEHAFTDLSRRLDGERETVCRWRARAEAAEAEREGRA